MSELTRPKLTFAIKVNDELQEIKMTYGLFNEVMNVVPSVENIGELLVTNQGLRDYIVRRMLSGSKRISKEEELVDIFDLDVDISDIDELVGWVGDHILYFFMTSAAKTAQLGQKYQATLAQLNQSVNGAAS